MSPPPADPRVDPYIAYTHRFFHRWLPVYDLFSTTIAYAYRAAVRQVDPRPGLSVLDICTGTGAIALRCARKGARVTGIDVTPAMLEKARRKAGEPSPHFRVMDARQLAFADRSFDVATLSFALHDMPRQVRLTVLAEAARVARERLVILDYAFPQRPWLRSLTVPLVARFETSYFKPFAAEGVLPLLAAAGLPSPRRVVRRPPCFAIYEVMLPSGDR
jgi:demethylmenaquinone methyltransferase/2-methoxy-6-polyprenyl-1,4-benzoquinol methylase